MNSPGRMSQLKEQNEEEEFKGIVGAMFEKIATKNETSHPEKRYSRWWNINC